MNCTSVSLLILLLWRGSSWVNLFISCDGEGELSIASPVRVYIIKMVRVRVMVRVMVRVRVKLRMRMKVRLGDDLLASSHMFEPPQSRVCAPSNQAVVARLEQ